LLLEIIGRELERLKLKRMQ